MGYMIFPGMMELSGISSYGFHYRQQRQSYIQLNDLQAYLGVTS